MQTPPQATIAAIHAPPNVSEKIAELAEILGTSPNSSFHHFSSHTPFENLGMCVFF